MCTTTVVFFVRPPPPTAARATQPFVPVFHPSLPPRTKVSSKCLLPPSVPVAGRSSFARRQLAAAELRMLPLQWLKQLNAPLEVVDPEIVDIIELEKASQWKGLELIPSENFTFVSIMQAVGSIMTNKYNEGYPDARYYGGNEYIDMVETLCQEAFRLDPAKWG
ncbi:Pyridoxal phosphate-dependent transferase, major domain, partial [Sesbania bispinosa]